MYNNPVDILSTLKKGTAMTKSVPDLLLAALDRRDIAPYIQREVVNAVFGPGAKNSTNAPPKLAWDAMRAPLQAHINSMRANRKRVHPEMLELRKEYYDCIVQTNKHINAQNTREPLPAHLTRWQAWVPKEKRDALTHAFKLAYLASSIGPGNRIVPFAPLSLRQANKERIKLLRKGIAAERDAIPVTKTGRTKLLINALTLLACRQAERALDKYEKEAAAGDIHAYDTPVKVNWRHYSFPETRERIRTYYATGHITSEGLDSFWSEGAGE